MSFRPVYDAWPGLIVLRVGIGRGGQGQKQ